MLQKILVFSFLIGFVFGVSIIPCKSNLPTPIQFDVEECADFPCPMYKGENAKANITFIVPEDTNSLKATIQAKVGPINTKYPIPDDEVCHYLTNGYCPLDAGERITYHLEVAVLKQFPKVKFEMETTFQDRNTKKDILCFKLIGQVTQRK